MNLPDSKFAYNFKINTNEIKSSILNYTDAIDVGCLQKKRTTCPKCQ